MKSITLTGFQVFDEPTTIPLERLTLLFGPNSAGKSAVEDALLLIQALVKDSLGGGELANHTPKKSTYIPHTDTSWPVALIRKNWRRESEYPLKLSPKMEISFSQLNFKVTYTLNLVTMDHWNEEDSFFFGSFLVSFRLEVEGDWLIEFLEFENASINYRNTVLLDKPISPTILKAIKGDPETLSYKNEVLAIWGNLKLTHQGARLDVNDLKQDKVIKMDGRRIETIRSHEFKIAIDEVKSIFDGLKIEYISKIDADFNLVPASRQIPKPEELVYRFDLESFDPIVSRFHLNIVGLERMEPLAASFFDSEAKSRSLRQSINAPWLGYEVLLKDRVNHSLTNDLFSERGYRIDCEVIDINTAKRAAKELDPCAVLLRLILVDSDKRRFDFTEVGSGLGYILPVLVAVWREDDVPNWVFIQQPELHLHPALQASLGDVFVNATSGIIKGRSLIIETHSEHLLLRILKRIRQTTIGIIPEEYRIKPEEVSVLYFNPSPDGRTRVSRLRISPDGDFLDRWPRGFFAERDKDLFDE